MRYEGEAREAMQRAGFEVLQVDGVDDWQGWGVLLGRKAEEYAVLSWSYGSCEVCDSYMELGDEECRKAFDELLERGLGEEQARAKFNERKGW